MESSSAAADRCEIAFFDVETTVPTRSGVRFELLEFGALLVCPKKLVELDSYSALVRPSDLSLINEKSVRCNGISRQDVATAPPFSQIADRVFDILHGRIWAGHNILRFDCLRIREAFAEIGRPPPEPKGTIDTLALLTQRFGKRAGNMKMASLASYFGLGNQMHRALDDVRMNLEVVKYCATVLFLESSLPDLLSASSVTSPHSSTMFRPTRDRGFLPVQMTENGSSVNAQMDLNPASSSPLDHSVRLQIPNPIPSSTFTAASGTESFNMNALSEQIRREPLQEVVMEENPVSESAGTSSSSVTADCSNKSLATFLTPAEVSVSSITASLVPFFRGYQRIEIMHNDNILKLHCDNLKVRMGLSTKFMDQAGRPRLSFVVNAPPKLCEVLDACDNHVQDLFKQSGSTSDWRPAVIRKDGYWNYPIIRLHIPTHITGDVAKYGTEIYGTEAVSGAEQKLEFRRFDASELENYFTQGTAIRAYFALNPYDYQQSSGIRLVAEKLVILSSR